MKVLILGGSGNLSGCLARTCVEAGHEVWTLTRGKRNLPEGTRSIIADRDDETAFAAAVKAADTKWDVVFDCICMRAEHARQDLQILSQYTSRVVAISTDSVYDPKKKVVPQSEESEYYLLDDDYAGNKRKMELEFLAAETELNWTLFRPGHIYGPGFLIGCFPEHSRSADLLAHIRADKPLNLVGGGTLLTQPIFVQDLADSMIDCVDKKATYQEIFCIGGPKAIENRYYYEVIGEIVGHPVTIHSVPEEGYVEAHPEFAGHLCQRSYRFEKLRKAGVKLPATSIEEGLRKHVEWLDSH